MSLVVAHSGLYDAGVPVVAAVGVRVAALEAVVAYGRGVEEQLIQFDSAVPAAQQLLHTMLAAEPFYVSLSAPSLDTPPP